MNKEKRLLEDKLIVELKKIQRQLVEDPEKASIMLTNLIKNIYGRVGKCFAMRKMGEFY